MPLRLLLQKGVLSVPANKDQIKFVKGDEGALTAYKFSSGPYSHLARCIQGINIRELKQTIKPGELCTEGGTPLTETEPEASTEVDGAKCYKGSCHCGAVTLSLTSKPIDHDYASEETPGPLECSCSICNGNIFLYIMKDQLQLQGQENLMPYAFGYKLLSKPFCKVCGVNPVSDWLDISPEALSAVPEETRAYRDSVLDFLAVNLRTIDGLSVNKLDLAQVDGANNGLAYANP
ncbi:unnamed protein product [Parascedosporium putredinis]|uniref:CENP-V/GFA domain-containing protein n=1 Tax=Parascedosporium putredinis TaxID=1442378 RepID=A0A9P1GZE2_9PEZI|nr:unnamed protein product [Parascedosporium putredinis]CAI7990735.1 unnamed protein product [Parascedosporium putredinis]